MPDEEDRLEQDGRRRHARRNKQRGRRAPGLGTKESPSRYRNVRLDGYERAAPEWLTQDES